MNFRRHSKLNDRPYDYILVSGNILLGAPGSSKPSEVVSTVCFSLTTQPKIKNPKNIGNAKLQERKRQFLHVPHELVCPVRVVYIEVLILLSGALGNSKKSPSWKVQSERNLRRRMEKNTGCNFTLFQA